MLKRKSEYRGIRRCYTCEKNVVKLGSVPRSRSAHCPGGCGQFHLVPKGLGI